MADYIYAADGRPRGFRLSNFIYNLEGVPVGRVWAEKAYSLSGRYVGAIVNHMIVDKPAVSRRDLPPISTPATVVAPPNAESRRPMGEEFADVFDRLLCEPAEEPAGA